MNTPSVSLHENSIHDYLDVFRRRKWLIACIIISSVVVAWVVYFVLPKSYRSSTLIVVENQRVPENYVKGVVTQTPQDRLVTIQQLILSRALLGRVIEDFKLYPDGKSVEDVIEPLRNRVKIATTREHAFVISFAHENPRMAQQVTAKLADLFIDQNLKTREQLVGEATEFLQTELNAAQAELEAKEKAISEFKLGHMGELPGQVEANLRSLDRLQAEMTVTSETINKLSDRLGQIEKAIKEYDVGEVSSAGSSVAGTITPGPSGRIDAKSSRLKELERNLATLSATYKETYPDIVHLKQEILRLKAQPFEEDETKIVREDAVNSGKNPEKKPVDPYHRELLRQRSEVKTDLSALKERHDRIRQQITQYEGRVERTPVREQQLASLLRDYDNMQRNYQTLLDKRLNARIAVNLEKRQKGEQFRIIDPANLPERPESPDFMKIMAAGLLCGCGLAFGTAFGLESLRRGFRYGEEAERLLGLPILAEIPSFQTVFGVSTRALMFRSDPPSRTQNMMSKALSPEGSRSSNNNGKSKKELLTLDRGMTPDLNLVMKWRPISVVAEQYRVAATRLVLMSVERKSTVVVVTSSLKGEGKTATALNVGYALAHDLGKRTLLIDCDLKRPKLNSYAGVALDPGLSKILQDEEYSVHKCLRQVDESPLWILPAGLSGHRPIELFKMRKLSKHLADLRSEYEYILLDAPPILPLADMSVLADMADVLVLVIKSGETRRDVAEKAMNTLKFKAQAGIILTGIQASETPSYMFGEYEYYATSDRPKR